MNRFKYPGLFDVSCKEEKTCMLTLWVFVGFFFGGGSYNFVRQPNSSVFKKCLNIYENINNAKHFLLPLHFRVHCKRASKYITVHFRGVTKNTNKIENT